VDLRLNLLRIVPGSPQTADPVVTVTPLPRDDLLGDRGDGLLRGGRLLRTTGDLLPADGLAPAEVLETPLPLRPVEVNCRDLAGTTRVGGAELAVAEADGSVSVSVAPAAPRDGDTARWVAVGVPLGRWFGLPPVDRVGATVPVD